MGFVDLHSTALVLGLGLSVDHHHQPQTSLTLSLSAADHHVDVISAANSSLSNVSSLKRGREAISSEDLEILETKVSSSSSSSSSSKLIDEFGDHGSNGRKKLRLTKAQSVLLEESFKHHSALNHKQKQDLARELKLRPRQVEVWFQNRRARTKLKQTEVDYALLKKCCERLTEENRKLQKEVQQLKALKVAQSSSLYMPAATTLAVCPSCGGSSGVAGRKSAFSMALKPHFCNPFTNPSPAC